MRSLCCAKAVSSLVSNGVGVGAEAGDGIVVGVEVVAAVHAVSSTSARLRTVPVLRIAHSFLLSDHFNIPWL